MPYQVSYHCGQLELKHTGEFWELVMKTQSWLTEGEGAGLIYASP